MALIYRPGDDENVGAGQSALPCPRGLGCRLGRKAGRPRYVGESAEAGRRRKCEESGAFRAFRVKVDYVALNVLQPGIRACSGLVGKSRGRGRRLEWIEADISFNPCTVDNHEPLPN